MKQKTENRKPITSQLFGVPISITSKSQALALVGEWLLARRARILNTEYRIPNEKSRSPHSEFSIQNSVLFPKLITTPNPEMIVAAQKDPEFLKALRSADLAIPDGIGIIWALRILNTEYRIPNEKYRIPNTEYRMADSEFRIQNSVFSPSRLSGLDLMESLIREPQKVGPFELKVMLLGGRPGIAEKAAAVFRRLFSIQYSEFSILALSGPQNISTISKSDNYHLISEINFYSPDLLFVAFGHGRQEKWLNDNRKRLNAGVAMGVGGALDQIADPSLRPPAYINSIGLGWLYRLFRQPWRWKRQLALIKFVGMIIREKLQFSSSKLQ